MNANTYILLGVAGAVSLVLLAIHSILARKKRERIKSKMCALLNVPPTTEFDFKRQLASDGIELSDDEFRELTMELEHERRIRILRVVHGSGSATDMLNSYHLPSLPAFRM